MDDLETISQKLKSMISKNRYIHSLGVMKTASKLANLYNVDTKKAKIAGLVHDCARELDPEEILKIAQDSGILLDDIEKHQIVLVHGAIAEKIAKEEFNITDKEILRAIRIHTTGDKVMSSLEKVVFLADYIEPGRNFPGVDLIREKAYKNLDNAILLAIDSTITHIVDKGELLHPQTVEARNSILLHRGRREKA